MTVKIMKPDDFLDLLKRHCNEKIKGEVTSNMQQVGKDEAYRDIVQYIGIYDRERANG